MKGIPSEGAWSFDAAGVAEQFDGHVREQLPWYELVTRGVAHVARHYVTEGGLVYDVGASTGNVGHALEEVLHQRHAHLIAIEKSAEMAKLWRGGSRSKIVVGDVVHLDLEPCDLVVMFLVMMFVDPAERLGLLRKMDAALRPGGALIIVDKCEAQRGYPATVLWRLALAEKLASGAKAEDIIQKELSLAGVQRPLCEGDLPMECVEWFRFGDFAGWLMEKGAHV